MNLNDSKQPAYVFSKIFVHRFPGLISGFQGEVKVTSKEILWSQ